MHNFNHNLQTSEHKRGIVPLGILPNGDIWFNMTCHLAIIIIAIDRLFNLHSINIYEILRKFKHKMQNNAFMLTGIIGHTQAMVARGFNHGTLIKFD